MEELNLDKSISIKSEKEIIREDSLEKLMILLHDFSDEIPTEIIHSSTINNKFKVRAWWFQAGGLRIIRLYKLWLLPDPFITEYDLCIKSYRKHHKENWWFTTKEDIDTMNTLLHRTIDYLQTHK